MILYNYVFYTLTEAEPLVNQFCSYLQSLLHIQCTCMSKSRLKIYKKNADNICYSPGSRGVKHNPMWDITFFLKVNGCRMQP